MSFDRRLSTEVIEEELSLEREGVRKILTGDLETKNISANIDCIENFDASSSSSILALTERASNS